MNFSHPVKQLKGNFKNVSSARIVSSSWSLCHAAIATWNSLEHADIDSLTTFKHLLKSHQLLGQDRITCCCNCHPPFHWQCVHRRPDSPETTAFKDYQYLYSQFDYTQLLQPLLSMSHWPSKLGKNAWDQSCCGSMWKFCSQQRDSDVWPTNGTTYLKYTMSDT